MFFLIALVLSSGFAISQTRFSAGFEWTGAVGASHDQGYRFGPGASLQAAFPISKNLDLTLYAGYNSYPNKYNAILDHFSVIPMLAGGKYKLGKIFISGQSGVAFNRVKFSNAATANAHSAGFAYVPGLGFTITRKIDLLVKYMGNSVKGVTFGSVGARLAYTIN